MTLFHHQDAATAGRAESKAAPTAAEASSAAGAGAAGAAKSEQAALMAASAAAADLLAGGVSVCIRLRPACLVFVLAAFYPTAAP